MRFVVDTNNYKIAATLRNQTFEMIPLDEPPMFGDIDSNQYYPNGLPDFCRPEPEYVPNNDDSDEFDLDKSPVPPPQIITQITTQKQKQRKQKQQQRQRNASRRKEKSTSIGKDGNKIKGAINDEYSMKARKPRRVKQDKDRFSDKKMKRPRPDDEKKDTGLYIYI
jgi:hypothetical protein